MARWWLPFLWLSVLLLAVNCGGGEEAPTGSTPDAGRLTPELQGTAEPTPIIIDGQFEAPAKGYAVQVPDGWTVHPNFLPSPFATDAFFAPSGGDGVRPNIAVVCEQLLEGTTLSEHFGVKTEIVRRIANVEPDVSSRQVAGLEALVARYGREDADPPLHKTEVVFISEGCGWSVSLTVPLGREAEYEPVLEDFLASFRLLS